MSDDVPAVFSSVERIVCCKGDGSDTLLASFEIESYQYFDSLPRFSSVSSSNKNEGLQQPMPNPTIQISIKSATTTRGGDIVSGKYDATGIMIWPATHLLCQHLALSTCIDLHQQVVLDLGCGCGLVGVVAMKTTERKIKAPKRWVATDMDLTALKLCQENFALNGFPTVATTEPDSGEITGQDQHQRVSIKRLEWGNDEDIQTLKSDLGAERFDSIVGADIVYPNTCGKALSDLLRTVDQLLSLESRSRFYLSFATRDGPKTPARLIEAASEAGFAISVTRDDGQSPISLEPEIVKRLPPLLDSKILVLRRSNHAEQENELLGRENCSVFPGLKAALARLEEASSSEDEWDAPFNLNVCG